MRKYIDEIDERFVERVVGEFLTKEWHASKFIVKKENDAWRVVYKIRDNYYDFNLTNFKAEFNKHYWCSTLDLRWRVAMYLNFGEEYYKDLEYFLNCSKRAGDIKAVNAEIELEKVKALKERNEKRTLYNTGRFL